MAGAGGAGGGTAIFVCGRRIVGGCVVGIGGGALGFRGSVVGVIVVVKNQLLRLSLFAA